MELRNDTAWEQYWDEETKTPFAVNGEKLITFDNEKSIYEKVKFAMEKGLAGTMVWSLDTDDFQGDCASDASNNADRYTNYPLMRSINKAIETALEDIKRNEENVIHHGKHEEHASFSARTEENFALISFAFIINVLCLL